MGKKEDQTHIYKPRTIRELTGLMKEYPAVHFIAGGTDFMRRLKNNPRPLLPSSIIALDEVDEFSKIKRRENNIEIGACVPLERIISLGSNVIPSILISVLSRIAGPSVRNSATLGGNIMLASPLVDAALPLLLLDARCEVRRLTTHAWIPLARFLKSPGKTTLAPSEVLSAISIPIMPWHITQYEKLDTITHPAFSILKFGALARVYRNTVTDFRMIFAGVDPLYQRNREIEALIIGGKIPFPEKLKNQFKERIEEYIANLDQSFLPDKYHRRTAARLAIRFLEKTNSYRETR